VYLLFPERVARFVKLILQKTLHAVVVAHVLLLDPVKSTDPIRGISCVIVAVPAVVKVAVSCGSGNRTDHVAVDQVVHDCQLVSTQVVNVIPELFQQFHDHHVIDERSHDQAQDPVISKKSTFEQDTVAAVSVLRVHAVFDFTSNRSVEEYPFIDNAPVAVKSELTSNDTVFPTHPLTVRL
jgi:hypothetical protein